jgi:hypothetical protein
MLIFLASFPVGYMINDATNRGINVFTQTALNKESTANG